MEGYEGKEKVANLFHSFHRTFHPPKRVVKRVISSIIIIYICLHTKQSYEGSRRFIYTFDTLSFDIRQRKRRGLEDMRRKEILVEYRTG